MSKTETSTMTTTVVYNSDKTHRYLLRKEWDDTLPEAMVLMLSPWKDKMQCIADANGKKFYHPLCPTVHHWRIGEFEYGESKAFKDEPSEIPIEVPTDFQEVSETQEVEEPPKHSRKRKKHNQSPNE